MLAQYYRIGYAAGVNIHLGEEDTALIDACVLVISKDNLDFEQKLTGVHTVKELAGKLPGKIPVAVNFTGRGILTKKTVKTAGDDKPDFSRVLPNGNPEDFYIQNFVSGEHDFVSVIRRAQADKWLEGFRQEGLQPLLISIGPFVVEQIAPQLNSYGEMLRFNGHVIEKDGEQHWNKYMYSQGVKADFAIKAENETLSEDLILPYAAGFQLILADRLALIKAGNPFLNTRLQTRLGLNKLKVHLVLLVLITFFVLLANYLALSYLRGSNLELSARLNSSNQNTAGIEALSAQILKKEQSLKEMGWEGYLHKSRYVEQLVQVMPHEITLDEISINPVNLTATQVNKELSFEKRQVSLQGTSPYILPVNEWMARIRTLKWAKDIQMENYSFNNERSTGSFVIIIQY